MAKAIVGVAGIEIIQGALKKPVKKDGHKHGSYLIMTHRTAATTNPNCQRIYAKSEDAYTRSTPLSSKELDIRERFRAVALAVSNRKKDPTKITADQVAFKNQKDEANGCKTMTKYLWKLEGETYDAQHPRG
ncbi:MAG: hypothetical protein J5875_02685 [Paludibacteraceae bacterium]|nr:hypothetical protein [Paludibacteraceae bacterium]